MTDNNGEYTIAGLAADVYRISFSDSSGIHARETYNNKFAIDLGDNINVTADGTVTINASLELGGKISGIVTGANGVPLEGICVTAMREVTPGQFAGFGIITGPSGEYDLPGLPAGPYILMAEDSYNSDAYEDFQQEVTVIIEQTVTVNIQMQEPETPVGPLIFANGMQGSVRQPQGVPVEVTVKLNAGEYAGVPADLWLVAAPEAGDLWYCCNAAMQWTPFTAGNVAACSPAYQGPLPNIANPLTVLHDQLLPVGSYTIYFAADSMDGAINLAGPILLDQVKVTIIP